MISDPDTALIFSQQGLSLAKKIRFINGEIVGLNQMASVYNITGNYPKALELFLEALQKSEIIKNVEKTGISLLNIGSVYYYQGDFKTAVIYTLQAKDLFERLHNTPIIMTVLLNLGDYYEKWNRLDSARYYTQQASDLAVTIHDTDFVGMTFNNLGNIYAKMGQPVIAIEFYRSGLPNLLKVGNDDAVCECSLGMAKLFQKSGEKDSCLYYAKLSMATAVKGGFTNRVLKAGDFLSEYHRSAGRMDSAYAYLSASNKAKDSLYSQEKLNQIQNLTFTELLRQQEKTEELSAARSERQKNIQYGIIGIGIVSFVLIFLLISRSIIVNEKWIGFLGILGLLLVFEFANLLLHPYISSVTHHSPLFILLISVAVAAILIPVHHHAENLIKFKLVEKNKKIRLASAKRTLRELEGGDDEVRVESE